MRVEGLGCSWLLLFGGGPAEKYLGSAFFGPRTLEAVILIATPSFLHLLLCPLSSLSRLARVGALVRFLSLRLFWYFFTLSFNVSFGGLVRQP
ncbi:hypothetical protein B0J18DRAFT_140238 [Chaetomium sp. MPI-SDFR-AT-0129]|nr:hypothetical protein B0J18DRAFT_140238 [Chaetomium sp. MPI-SDFR-AT-0129]